MLYANVANLLYLLTIMKYSVAAPIPHSTSNNFLVHDIPGGFALSTGLVVSNGNTTPGGTAW